MIIVGPRGLHELHNYLLIDLQATQSNKVTVNPIPKKYRFYSDRRTKPFIHIVGKGENSGEQHSFLFPQYFHLKEGQVLTNELPLICCLQMLSIWTSPKFCLWVKG